jgi:hypothetical protein
MAASNHGNRRERVNLAPETHETPLRAHDGVAELKPNGCIIVLLRDSGHFLEGLLENVSLRTIGESIDRSSANASMPTAATDDPWLGHADAAMYLGVARSTLYRYSCQEKIETRKLGGRLEYRRSTLDHFKIQQIRPARRSCNRGTIVATLGSGN